MNLSSNGRKFAVCPITSSVNSVMVVLITLSLLVFGASFAFTETTLLSFSCMIFWRIDGGDCPPVLLTVACVGQAGLALHWRPALMRWYIADITVAHAFSSSSLSYYSGPVSSSDSRNSSQLLLDQNSSTLKGEEQHVAKNRLFIANSQQIFFC